MLSIKKNPPPQFLTYRLKDLEPINIYSSENVEWVKIFFVFVLNFFFLILIKDMKSLTFDSINPYAVIFYFKEKCSFLHIYFLLALKFFARVALFTFGYLSLCLSTTWIKFCLSSGFCVSIVAKSEISLTPLSAQSFVTFRF